MENERTHGFVMLGRSDATLNPNGVRFGTAELYAIRESVTTVLVRCCRAAVRSSNSARPNCDATSAGRVSVANIGVRRGEGFMGAKATPGL